MFRIPTKPVQTSDQPLEIESIVKEMGLQRFATDARGLALIADAAQRWKDFLDDLELSDLSTEPPVIVKAEGKTIKFSDPDKMADWIAENIE